MTKQAYQAGDTAAPIAPLRTLAELGDDGMGRLAAATDMTPRLPFPIHPGWYERYWYGDHSPSRWGVLINAVWRHCSEISRIAETIRRVSPRTIQRLRSIHT
jgi:hypothetical protein